MNALKFITCGSVDDGKSTLIGRLLVDSRTVLQDQLASITHTSHNGETTTNAVDLARLTDGLQAEREQGITIDVAWRYFSTAARKFIIGDTPGHVQYTRNMVTAASTADAAIVLVDATKLDWQLPNLQLLPQTCRHSLLVNLLRVHSIIFAVNKLDAVADPERAFTHISAALDRFTSSAGIQVAHILPVSALQGHNVVDPTPGWAGYRGPSLLTLLEQLPSMPPERAGAFSFPVQWVENFSDSSDTSQGRRVYWGRIATGNAKAGDRVRILPSGQEATIAQIVDHSRQANGVSTGHSAGLVLDREVDVSRGDWLVSVTEAPPRQSVESTIAWMDDEPLVAGRTYFALHGHRWINARVKRISHRLNIETLQQEEATELAANSIGHVELILQEPVFAMPYEMSRISGAMILVDKATHKTAGALMLH